MVEDVPATIEHGSQRRVMGTVHGMVLGRGICRRNSWSVSSMISAPCDMAVVWCPNTRPVLLEILRYDTHLNTNKLKVNKFVVGLNVKIHAKVRIMLPQTLHDTVQKALIAKENLTSGG
jgi:hypothetical protein